jgi:hypothetical protein
MGRYAVLRHAAAENLDLVMFLGDGAKAVQPTCCALPGAPFLTPTSWSPGYRRASTGASATPVWLPLATTCSGVP